MRIISVWSLELESCQLFNIETHPRGRYTLRFVCGLVVSSRFFNRLSLELKKWVVIVHKTHHGAFHNTSTPYGFISYAYIQDRPGVSKKIACGPGCSSYSQNGNINILDRSDIIDKPLAKIKEDGKVFELRLTVSNQLLCSCMSKGIEQISGQICRHVINLLSGNSKGVTWDNTQKDTVERVIKRKMLLDD